MSSPHKNAHFTALPALFFDLEEDPAELRNLADDPAYRGLVLEYAQKMLSWRMSHEDRALTNWVLTADAPSNAPRGAANGAVRARRPCRSNGGAGLSARMQCTRTPRPAPKTANARREGRA